MLLPSTVALMQCNRLMDLCHAIRFDDGWNGKLTLSSFQRAKHFHYFLEIYKMEHKSWVIQQTGNKKSLLKVSTTISSFSIKWKNPSNKFRSKHKYDCCSQHFALRSGKFLGFVIRMDIMSILYFLYFSIQAL